MAILGLDFLGLGSRHWNVDETLKAFPQGFALGLFGDDTFGPNAIKNTKRFLESGKVAAVRVQMHWSYQHQIVPTDKLKKLAKAWEAVARTATVPFYLSHSCEYSNNNKAEIRKRITILQQEAPSCFIVQTPMKSPIIPGFSLEQHGSKARAKAGDLVSADGSNVPDIDSAAWVQKNALASHVFGWGYRFNLSKAGPKIPAPDRKAYPSAEYIKGIIRCMLPKEPCPVHAAPGKVAAIKDPLLYKVYAEDTGDKRGNRPLIMLPKKTDRVQICTLQGAILGQFIYFGSYPNGTQRFYSGLPGGLNLYGWQIAERCRDVSGSEWGYIKQGNTFYGPVHFAFRQGVFRD